MMDGPSEQKDFLEALGYTGPWVEEYRQELNAEFMWLFAQRLGGRFIKEMKPEDVSGLLRILDSGEGKSPDVFSSELRAYFNATVPGAEKIFQEEFLAFKADFLAAVEKELAGGKK